LAVISNASSAAAVIAPDIPLPMAQIADGRYWTCVCLHDVINIGMSMGSLHTLIWQTRPFMQQINATVDSALAGTGFTLSMRAVLELRLSGGAMTAPTLASRLEI
jgi:hypothetical protein